MTEMMTRALAASAWLLVTDNVWMVVGAVPFWDRLRVKRSTMALWMIGVALAQSVMTYFTYLHAYGTPAYPMLVLARKFAYYGLIVVFYMRGFTVRWTQLLFVFLFLQNLSTMVNDIAFMLSRQLLAPGTVISMALTPLYPALIVVMNIPAGLWCAWYFHRTVRPAMEELSAREALTLCGVPIVMLLANQALNAIHNETNGGAMMSTLYLLMIIAGLAAFLLNMRLMRESSQRARLAAENVAMGQMLDLQQRSYAQLTDGIERAQTLRHDVRFQHNVITGYLKQGETDKALMFLDEYNQTLQQTVEPRICLNNAVDIIARHFIGQIRSLGIAPEVHIVLPEDPGIESAELVVVFGNLLENALHSLQPQGGKGTFSARCETDEGAIVIAIDNTCPDQAPIKKGIGLSSVTAVAQRHGGTAKFEREDGMFKASVILYR